MGPEAKIGVLNTINPVLIIVGLVLFIPISNKFDIFKMLTNGAIVSALSLFALLIPWRWLSGDMVTAYYMMAIIAMVLLSIGEVIWSPKLNEYTAAIAPEGQEGSYLGMSMMPWFAAKVAVSAMSGHMLTRWAPEGIGEKLRQGTVAFWDSPEAMWLILGIWALAGPIIAIVFQSWFTKGARWKVEHKNANGEPAPAAAEAESA
jgi:dipeptide/tripeptide permease